MSSLLLIEDDLRLAPQVAQALERVAAGELRVTVANDGASGIAAARAGAFDLALVDLGLPDQPGLKVIEQLSSLVPPVPALVFTVFDDREQVLSAAAAGAVGYVLKEEPVERVLAWIRDCLAGHMAVSSRVAKHLFALCRPADTNVSLTAREREVLDCVTRGLTYAESARALGVGIGTIQTHIKSLYRKLDVSSKAEAAAWATRHRADL